MITISLRFDHHATGLKLIADLDLLYKLLATLARAAYSYSLICVLSLLLLHITK